MKYLSPLTISAALLLALAGCGSDSDTGRKLSRLTSPVDGKCPEGSAEACLAIAGDGEPQCGCVTTTDPITELDCLGEGGSIQALPEPDPAARLDCEEGKVELCGVSYDVETEETTTECFCIDYNEGSGSTPGGGEAGDEDDTAEALTMDEICVIPPAPGEGDPQPLGPTPDPVP